MSLEVLVGRAVNLSAAKSGKINPFVQLDLRGVKKETSFKNDASEPAWEETVTFDLSGTKPLSEDDVLAVQVYSHETLSANRLLGSGSVSLASILNGKGPQKLEVQLEEGNKIPAGVLYLTGIHRSDNGDANLPSKEKSEQFIPFLKPREFSNKPEKFQIRVKIVEARQLVGENINPVCTVRVGDELHQTKVERETNHPWWDQSFLFNVTQVPSQLFEESVVFQVLNSKFMRSKAFIGSFVLTIQSIYKETNHTYLNKWMVLGNPEDDSAGVLGYLKASIAVLGAGDECPNFKSSPQNFEEDVEMNVLWPDSGIILQPATFTLVLYQAEDLPRMDANVMDEIRKFFGGQPSDKELVDPYMTFSFCGRKVSSKILYTTDSPKWFQELHLGFLFPSLCNSVKLTLLDWDRINQDDVIATSYLDLGNTSSPGEEGFLPTFGPCFINFYGSSREFSVIQSATDDDMNEGKIEGFAYRGRALIALKTSLGSNPETPVTSLDTDEQLRISPFCRRRKYILKAVFFGASMMSETTDPVEFEVSMGMYGDRSEGSTLPSISTTQPTNAVFDGSLHYFMPWLKSKPCVMIPCQWEDISFRLETLNILDKTLDKLDKGLELLEHYQRAGISNGDQELLLAGILDQLIFDCSVDFPEPIMGYHVTTTLDSLNAKIRTRKLEELVDSAKNLQGNLNEPETIVEELKAFRNILKSVAVEPQNSMPDVIISMIVAKKRIAYYRIPAHAVLYSQREYMTGRLCDQIQTLQLKVPGQEQSEKIPALIQVKLWLGLDSQSAMLDQQDDSEMIIFAETFENQTNMLGSWKSRSPTMSRPAWSDASGQLNLPQDKFVAPEGWAFDGDWFIDPELTVHNEQTSGINTFLQILLENQSRSLTGTWHPATPPWTDIRGNPTSAHCDLECPPGWEWEDCWQVDLNRAVDEEGWEYAIDPNIGGFAAAEKTLHMFRCRRWTCKRILKDPTADEKKTVGEKRLSTDEGWEYAPMFTMQFHAHRQTLDMVRRRRWHRKLKPISQSSLPRFHFADMKRSASPAKEGGTTQTTFFNVPRVFLVFKEEVKYQMNIYIYQARDLIAGDKTGFSDPYACAAFHTRSQQTEIIKQTLCPQWDQTLVFEQLVLYSHPRTLQQTLPKVVIEIYDHDNIGAPELLGRTIFDARIKISEDQSELKLNWYSVSLGKKPGGEILAAAEIFQVNGEVEPPSLPTRGSLFQIPDFIKPTVRRMAVEILCWGVRNMKTYELLSVSHPSVTFEIGPCVVQSSVIKRIKENPNFPNPLLFLDLYLPEEQLYMPPVNIKVKDHRQFGRTPVVGVHVITSLQPYSCEPRDDSDDTDSESDETQQWPDTTISMPPDFLDDTEDDEFDWWAKYYASIGDLTKCGDYLQQGYEPIQIYDIELERVEPFEKFKDFLATFPLHRGKNLNPDDNDGNVGEFKGTLRVYPLPEDVEVPLPPKILQWIPNTGTEEVVVRVYIVQGYDLAPKDTNGLADPYVVIKLGKQKQSSRKQYKPNTLNPLFGHMFELKATLPLQKDILIQVYDMDLIGSDDLIGQTTVDLEDRYLTQHRATCGLPLQYFTRGPYKWRDPKTPRQILETVCRTRNLPTPRFKRGAIHMGKSMFTIHDFEKRGRQIPPYQGPADQRLALHILHTLDLVPEHVETRRLYNPSVPGLDQGKLEMWVDILPKSEAAAFPPVDISPRVAQKYELRCIIWNTKEVIFKDVNIAGEQMSDIYVKGWLEGSDDVQKTDVHYRSTDGEGNFNWRFVFPFEYLKAEKMIKVNKKEHFWEMDATEYFYPPKLCIQIWDNDIFASDDFIGYLELDLLNAVKPAKQSESCGPHQLKGIMKKGKKSWWKKSLKKAKDKILADSIDLFEKKHIYGYWPCIDDSSGELNVTGKLEMEIELLNQQESEEKPAGKARDEPNANPHLEPPKRPEIMLQMFLTPWKAFRYGVWDKIKWHVLTVFLIFLLLLFVLIAFYALPQAAVDRIVNSF